MSRSSHTLSDQLDVVLDNIKPRKNPLLIEAIAKPLLTFLYNYLIKLDIIKGSGGLVHSGIKSLESFLDNGEGYVSKKRNLR